MKAFLVLTALLVFWPEAALTQNCDIPPTYPNQVVVDDGTMRVRYATDKTVYAPTEVISFYLVVQNLGATTFYMNWGIDPQDGHFILRPPFESWEECCATEESFDANVLLYLPTFIYFFSPGTTLAPGQCRVWQRTINLNWAPNPPAGVYAVLGGMFHVAFDWAGGQWNQNFVVPAGGAKLHITIGEPVDVEPSTWGRVKALYR